MENFAIKFEAKELYIRILWSLEHLFGVFVDIPVPVVIEGKDYPASEALGKLNKMIKQLPYNEIKELNLDLDVLRKANENNCIERSKLLLQYNNENATYDQNSIDDLLIKIQNDFVRFEDEVSLCIDYISKLQGNNEQEQQSKPVMVQTTPQHVNNEKLPFHFNSSYKKEQLQVVFERLKEFKYLHADSDLETWLYVCAGYGNSGQIKPLNWVKDQDLLAVLVDTLFSDSNSSNLWVISKNVFTVKDKKPNIGSMKNIISRIGRDCHTKTEKFIKLEDLLRI